MYLNTPPCDDWCRAKFPRPLGPPPSRGANYPLGYPWLKAKAAEDTARANTLLFLCWDSCLLAASLGTDYLSEFPENLGRRREGMPASPFALAEFETFLKRSGGATGAMFQCFFEDTDVRKPSRWTSTLAKLAAWKPLYMGMPILDSNGWYKGPLPPACGHESHANITGKDAEGRFLTSSTAAYGPQLCTSVADDLLLGSWLLEHPLGGTRMLPIRQRFVKWGSPPHLRSSRHP